MIASFNDILEFEKHVGEFFSKNGRKIGRISTTFSSSILVLKYIAERLNNDEKNLVFNLHEDSHIAHTDEGLIRIGFHKPHSRSKYMFRVYFKIEYDVLMLGYFDKNKRSINYYHEHVDNIYEIFANCYEKHYTDYYNCSKEKMQEYLKLTDIIRVGDLMLAYNLHKAI